MSKELHAGLVSVVIPVFNCDKFLAQAIESVLQQDYENTELVVVDDGSTDRSGEIAESFGPRVRCLRQGNGGISKARNAGVAASGGEYLAFLDADDFWQKQKLVGQMEKLISDPAMAAVFGLVDHIYEGDAAARYDVKVSDASPGMAAGAMLIRRDAFDRVGPFNEQRGLGEFIEWYSRAQDAGLQTMILPEVVLYRRIHGDNTTIREASNRSHYLSIVRSALERRRSAGG